MNTTGLPLWLRIVIGIALVLFIWWRISRKWDRAAAYSDGMAAEEEEQKKWYAICKTDTRVQDFKREAQRRYAIAEESMAGADSYVMKYMGFYNDKGLITSPNDETAICIRFFLKGKDHLLVSKVLATGEISEVKINGMSFNLSLPEWVKRKW